MKGVTTQTVLGTIRVKPISTHTPVKGVTSIPLQYPCPNFYFNPHTRERCDFKRLPFNISNGQFQPTHPWKVWLNRKGDKITISWFQPTHPWKVWPSIFSLNPLDRYFNPHTRERCDSDALPLFEVAFNFNPHTRERCDEEMSDFCVTYRIFQPTHPWKVWLLQYKNGKGGRVFQPTHPWKVWPGIPLWYPSAGWTISTHTPVKGVTSPVFLASTEYMKFQPTHPWKVWLPGHMAYVGYTPISTHTPVKGVTKQIGNAVCPKIAISTHTPVKGVTEWSIQEGFLLLISTHTPVKGVTTLLQGVWSEKNISTHTPVKGVTDKKYFSFLTFRFQPTHPWKVWPSRSARRSSLRVISTHTPVKGVTRNNVTVTFNPLISTHTPVKGVTTRCLSIQEPYNLFQPTHPWKVWLLS